MKNTKRMLVSLFCILVLCVGLVLTSCGCDHEWSEWEITKEATCGEKGSRTRTCSLCEETETEDIKATGHSGDGIVCENCLLPTFELPARDEALDFSSIGLKITGLKLVTESWQSPESNLTASVDLAEFYATLDEEGKLLGYGAGKLNSKLTNVQGHSSDIDAVVAVKENVVYISLLGKFPTSTQNFKNYMQFEVEKVGTFVQLQEKLKEYTEQAEQFETAYGEFVETWLEETLAPIFEDVNVDVDVKPVTKLAAKLINAFFKKTDDGFVFTVDTLKAWNEALAEKSVVEIFDDVLGEGSFDKVVEFLTDDKTYALSVADVIEYIEDEQGVDLAALLDALDALVAEITENEDATLESVIATYLPEGTLPEGFDLGAYLEDENILALSVADALVMTGMDNPETERNEAVEAIKGMVEQYATMLEETTVYELVFGSMGGQAAPIDDEAELEAMIEATVERINGMLDEAASLINLAIVVEDGKFASLDIVEMIDDNEFAVSVYATEDGVAMDYTMSVSGLFDAEVGIEFIPGHTVTENADKIAAIKTEVAKAPVTKAVLKALLEEEYKYYGNVTILDDTAKSRFVVVTCSPYDYYADENYAKIKAYVFNYDDAYAVVVSPDCKDTVEVTLSYNFYEATATVQTTFETVGEFINALTIANVNVPDEALDITDRNFDYYYNTKTGAVTFESAHDYDNDADEQEPDNCEEICKITFTCENCNDVYYQWASKGHYFELSYELKDATKGIKGGFYVVLTCQNDGCESNIDKVSVSVDTGDLAVSAANANVAMLGNGIFFAFTASEDATYEISSVITNGKELHRDVAIFAINGTGFDDIVNVGYDKTEWSYDFEVEEGKTYIVKLSTYRYETQPGAEATIKFTKKVAE